MRRDAILILLAGSLAMAACRTTVEADPSFRVETDDYRVTVESTPPRGHFCPPGLARQGRC